MLPPVRLLDPRLRRRLPRWSRDLRWFAAWLVLVTLIEWAGRESRSEPVALASLVLLVGMAVLTARGHRQRSIGWVRALSARLRAPLRRLEGLGFSIGVDLRHDPILNREMPRLLGVVLVGSVSVAVVAALGHGIWLGAIDALGRLVFTLEVAILGLLWITLLVGGALFGWMFVASAHDHLPTPIRHLGTFPRRTRRVAMFGLVAGLLLVGSVAPAWIALTGIAVALAASIVAECLGGRSGFDLLWRAAGESNARVFAGRTLLFGQVLIAAAVGGALILVVVGPEAVGGARSPRLPFTGFVGRLFAWLAFGGTAGMAGTVLLAHGYRLAFERAARRPHRLRLHGVGPQLRTRLRRDLRAAGFEVCFDAEASRVGEVVCRCDLEPTPVADPFWATSWPLEVSVEELTEADTLARLRRRSGVVHRRLLVRGVERQLGRARATVGDRGDGFWLAPQHWFLSGPCRDVPEPAAGEQRLLEPGGRQPWWTVLSWRTRVHFAVLMRDLDIDLLFVEDGVSLTAVRSVLETMFELHDVFGGRTPLTERHFRGVPGVRVLLHDCGVEQPPRSDGYPEPEYREVARARVLHVFRDRGGEREDVPVHGDRTGRSTPLIRS